MALPLAASLQPLQLPFENPAHAQVAFRNNHTFPKADTHTLRWSIKYAWARG